MPVEIVPLLGFPEIVPGTELGALLSAAIEPYAPCFSDILVVTQKIVSKAEARFVDLGSVAPGAEALRLAGIVRKDPRLIELVLAESIAIIRAVPNVLITRHRSGLVMANAGIDRSNLGPADNDIVLLLPEDCDASANRLRSEIKRELGLGPAVVITDSFGRPWRMGVVNVAIGSVGLPALVDRRGTPDRDGRQLEVTEIGLADMIASAAGLVMGEGDEGVPAALIRGLSWTAAERPAASLVRPVSEDLFQ